ncbi:MAG: hypothetical protein B1H03_07130, partial [Planctomycetales bacterium 4484_113]
GSVLAAVGTALPETLVALIALMMAAGQMGEQGRHIGIGAILGAPFMLSTLAFFIIGATYFVVRATGSRKVSFFVEPDVIRNDLTYFFWAFSLVAVLALLRQYVFVTPRMHLVDSIAAIALIVLYLFYARRAAQSGQRLTHWTLNPLYLQRKAAIPVHGLVILQLVIALAVMIGGSRWFVLEVAHLAGLLHMPTLLLAILLVPVATELPEKFNSLIWVRRGRDTLAVGNVSGAMIFQVTFPVSVGLFFTTWAFAVNSFAFLAVVLTLISSLLVIADIKVSKKLRPRTLLIGGLLYLVYVTVAVVNVYHPFLH